MRGQIHHESDVLNLPGCSTLRNLETNASAVRSLLQEELGFEPSKPVHLIVSRECKPRKSHDVTWHRSPCSYPDRSFLQLSQHVYASAPELTFAQLATTTSALRLIAIGFELCGSYPHSSNSLQAALTTKRRLTAYLEKAPHVSGLAQAKRTSKLILNGSASPMETAIAMELTLPYKLGGKNFPAPTLNKKMVLSKAASQIAGRRSLVYDLYWPEAKLAIEYDSQQFHSNNSARIKDSQKRAAAAKMGVTLVSITERQYRNILEFDEIAQMLARILGHRIRPRSSEYRQKRLFLRAQLIEPHHHHKESL